MSFLKQALPYIVIIGVSCVGPTNTGDSPNESSAIEAVIAIVTSQITYSATIGEGSYAISLAELENADLIDSVLGSGIKEGYVLSTGVAGRTLTVNASPLSYGQTGNRSFYADETGVIRFTRENRPATVDDPPLGQ